MDLLGVLNSLDWQLLVALKLLLLIDCKEVLLKLLELLDLL